MNLSLFNTVSLFDAATDLFRQLNIKLNSNTTEPLPVRDLLKQHFKETENGIFKAIEKTFYIGTLDNTVLSATGMFDESYSYKQALQQADKNYEGLMLFALELKRQPTRTEISELTRAFNRISQKMPVALVLKYSASFSPPSGELEGALISICISERFKYLQHWRQGEKAGKVIILRDIKTINTHRGHNDILEQLVKKSNVTNYNELHQHWLQVLDVSVLNKKFYEEIFNWYLWASRFAKFPQIRDKKDLVKEEVHQSESLIRLLTRLLFCWFMKEKGLINDDLFNKESVLKILKNIDEDDSSFYKAILQNLFFATLNKPIDERKIIDKGWNKKEYGDPLVYRYEEHFLYPEKLLSYFENIPFLNGGLFDCLDQKKDKNHPEEIRLDGFSTKAYKQPIVPNKLFFGSFDNVDLSKEYDDKKKNHLKVKGIIDILSSYKFTIEESTPVEEEIALDPELLGRVFENLLASYNPETKTTARKQTGSFYTPPPIVNYMVDESISEYLKQKLNDGSKENDLRNLIGYTNEKFEFTDAQKQTLIKAISDCRILDPACGSGAFPMGMLQRMIHILKKLDPENKVWLNMVVANFPEYMQHEMRKKLEVENWDYVRKIGIIQECIYGVDIQPIATQISKLRFFISLLVDQQEKPNKPNRGFDPLPNLDFKLVTANTLIAPPETDEVTTGLFAENQDVFYQEFEKLTTRYFSTYRHEEKKKVKEEIEKLITEKCSEKIKQIENLIKSPDEKTRKALQERYKERIANKKNEIALWESYQNLFKQEAVKFFDVRYFFPNVTDGFDIVIGNPPYIKEYTFKDAFDGVRTSPYYQGKMDLWYLFACKNLDNLKKKSGVLCFIATNNWTTNSGASKMRTKVLNDSTIHMLLDFGSYMIFESADIQTMVMLFRNDNENDNYNFELRRLVGDKIVFEDVLDLVAKKQTEKTEYLIPKISKENLKDKSFTFSNDVFEKVLDKIKAKANFILNENTEVAQGIVLPQDLLNKPNQKILGDKFRIGQGVFVLSDDEKEDLDFNKKELELIKPYYTTNQIHRWYADSENVEWIIYTDSKFKYAENIKPFPNIKKHLDKFQKVITSDNKPYGLHRSREEYFFKDEKIIVLRKCANEPMFTYTDFDCYVSATFYVIKSERINLKYLTAILNSKLIEFWLRNKGKMQGNNYQLDKEPLLQIPIFNTKEVKPIASIVDKIISTKKKNPKADIKELEKQLDEMVYKLYELTPDEIAVVEGKNDAKAKKN